MWCNECDNTDCVLHGKLTVLNDRGGIVRCYNCEYAKLPMVNEACRECWTDKGCGFIERMDKDSSWMSDDGEQLSLFYGKGN